MTGADVAAVIEEQVAPALPDQLQRLRQSLVEPRRTNVINRTVREGELRDSIASAWLVFEEDPVSGSGYKIVFDDEDGAFGLATRGFPQDAHLVMCGWYGDLLTAFVAM